MMEAFATGGDRNSGVNCYHVGLTGVHTENTHSLKVVLFLNKMSVPWLSQIIKVLCRQFCSSSIVAPVIVNLSCSEGLSIPLTWRQTCHTDIGELSELGGSCGVDQSLMKPQSLFKSVWEEKSYIINTVAQVRFMIDATSPCSYLTWQHGMWYCLCSSQCAEECHPHEI